MNILCIANSMLIGMTLDIINLSPYYNSFITIIIKKGLLSNPFSVLQIFPD